MTNVCLVVYCAAGAGYFSSVLSSTALWLGNSSAGEAAPEAGCQVLHLQVIVDLSFHLQLRRSF